MPIEVRKCQNDHVYEAVVIGGACIGVVSAEDERITCPLCGSPTFERQLGIVQLPGINAYPYFNRGLNAMVTSKQHFDRLCAEKGLVPIGDQHEQLLAEQQRARDTVIRERKEREEATKRQPGYREYENWTKGRQCADEKEEIAREVKAGRL